MPQRGNTDWAGLFEGRTPATPKNRSPLSLLETPNYQSPNKAQSASKTSRTLNPKSPKGDPGRGGADASAKSHPPAPQRDRGGVPFKGSLKGVYKGLEFRLGFKGSFKGACKGSFKGSFLKGCTGVTTSRF